MDLVEEKVDAPPTKGRSGKRHRFRYSLPGLWVALAFVCLSFTPSLLPRSGGFQGAVAGLSGAIGYGLGVAAAAIWREFADREPRSPKPRSWRIFFIAAAVLLVVSVVLGQRWQWQLRDLMGVTDNDALGVVLMPFVGAVVFVLFVALGRLLRGAYRWLARLLSRWVGPRAARATGWAVVAILTFLLLSGVIYQGFLDLANESFALRNDITPEGVEQPASSLRSGSAESLVPWDSLGREGRKFVATGPTEDQISAFTGESAAEPIRAFAGLESAEDARSRAALAVRDLDRAGGFARAYLMVATTTGSGWLDPGSVDSFEYIAGGDSAIVGMQYSFLPSWISFLVDQQKAREAGRELFDAVYDKWSKLPADSRPRIVVFGESLGSFGGETAFSGDYDLANRTSGALFAGPPSSNTLAREFTDERDAGSPEIEPVVREGATVRFTNEVAEDIPPSDSPWNGTRVLYLQHPSDPIVWWSPHLVLGRPDWLREDPGRDVLDEMVWIPFVTFWQVTADMTVGTSVPSGHGHKYTGDLVDGWATVLQPTGWTDSKSDELKSIVLGE